MATLTAHKFSLRQCRKDKHNKIVTSPSRLVKMRQWVFSDGRGDISPVVAVAIVLGCRISAPNACPSRVAFMELTMLFTSGFAFQLINCIRNLGNMYTNTSFVTKLSSKLALLLCLSANFTSVSAETLNCTAITSLPIVISTPGSYCLTGNISTALTSGNAIEIRSDHVILDFNGYYIDNTAGGTSQTARGVVTDYPYGGFDHIAVRNGTVKGFFRGISLNIGPSALPLSTTVEDMRVVGSLSIGIFVDGRGAVIRRNMILHTGVDGLYGALGLKMDGKGHHVLDNLIFNTVATAEQYNATGIWGYAYGALEVRGNVVAQTTSATFGNSLAYEVATNHATIRDNFAIDAFEGFRMSVDDKYMGNMTRNVLVPFISGIAVGHND